MKTEDVFIIYFVILSAVWIVTKIIKKKELKKNQKILEKYENNSHINYNS